MITNHRVKKWWVVCLGLVLGLSTPGMALGDEKEDEEAIKARVRGFFKALTDKDAKEVASYWTPKGEYVYGDDITIRGRENLEKAYGELFTKKGKGEIEVKSNRLRFLSKDTALGEGKFLAKNANPAEQTLNNFSILYIREEGQWYFAMVREWPDSLAIDELDWLVGTWEGKVKGNAIKVEYSWEPGKAFLIGRYSLKGKEGNVTGTDIIGRDPSSVVIRSWTFQGDGSVGESTWVREEKRWVLKTTTVPFGGGESTSTNILTPSSHDSFTWVSINRIVEGEELPNTEAITLTRVKKAP